MGQLDTYFQQMDHRISKLEYINGVTRRKKPQAFVDIDNHFAEIKKFVTAKFKILDCTFENIESKMKLKEIIDLDLGQKMGTCEFRIGQFESKIENLSASNQQLTANVAKETKYLDEKQEKLAHQVRSDLHKFTEDCKKHDLILAQFKLEVESATATVRKNSI